MIHTSQTRKIVTDLRNKSNSKNKSASRGNESSVRSSDSGNDVISNLMETNQSFDNSERVVHTVYGSFYLRLGTVLFGIGSLIYTGIEIGGIFEDGLLGEIPVENVHQIHCT